MQTQLKVEPCVSAGPKGKKKGARSGQVGASGSAHAESAPKASRTSTESLTWDYAPALGEWMFIAR